MSTSHWVLPVRSKSELKKVELAMTTWLASGFYLLSKLKRDMVIIWKIEDKAVRDALEKKFFKNTALKLKEN